MGVLDIRGCFITALPPEVQRLAGPSVHTIDMSDNLMPQLPNLRPLCYTREVRIGSNLLTSLPESIRLLSCLTALHVPENQLRSVPAVCVCVCVCACACVRACVCLCVCVCVYVCYG